ncbi:riboflavin synthase [Benzoatithermus flavus]|uniref:Riboflavin synthase n=1 Tax=Benzoatithermus flavus TaxID=3108223 RepID=A0ABU8XL64_9PROT
MFTGIITHLGEIVSVREVADGRELVVKSDLPLAEIPLGASIAHSGICLTVVASGEGSHAVQASPETLARTTLGSWRAGTRVNLERSLRLGDELGGHLVFGHVDAVGEIVAIEPEGGYRRVEIALPPTLAPMVAVKGSIAVDGISLTVNEAGRDRFAVTIIPHTWAHTTLADRRPGDPVNLEADMLARYVARQLAFARPA